MTTNTTTKIKVNKRARIWQGIISAILIIGGGYLAYTGQPVAGATLIASGAGFLGYTVDPAVALEISDAIAAQNPKP